MEAAWNAGSHTLPALAEAHWMQLHAPNLASGNMFQKLLPHLLECANFSVVGQVERQRLHLLRQALQLALHQLCLALQWRWGRRGARCWEAAVSGAATSATASSRNVPPLSLQIYIGGRTVEEAGCNCTHHSAATDQHDRLLQCDPAVCRRRSRAQ